MTSAHIGVRPAQLADKPILRQLLEFTAYEHSRFDGSDLDGHGMFGYRYLDHYWTEPERHPYLITAGGRIAGMALIREGPPHRVAEFLVMPRFRRAGVGTVAARELFSGRPGPWEVRQVPGHDAAVAFWRHAIPVPFTEEHGGQGTVQHFVMTAG